VGVRSTEVEDMATETKVRLSPTPTFVGRGGLIIGNASKPLDI
jgi:hypothetical protein